MSIPETGISLAEFESSFLGSWKVSVGLMVRTHTEIVTVIYGRDVSTSHKNVDPPSSQDMIPAPEAGNHGSKSRRIHILPLLLVRI